MSNDRQLKKIDLQTLDAVDRKIAFSKVKRVCLALAAVLVLAGGGYVAFVMIAGDVVAARFAVTKMYCPACVITVKESASKVPGVVGADVSLAAQDVIVKFRNKQTSTDAIKKAIDQAGYPSQADGMFKPEGNGINDVLVALVNGKPVFGRDIKLSVNITDPKAQQSAPTSAFFSTVGKEILIQAADAATVVVQPSEIDQEIQDMAKRKNTSPEAFLKEMADRYGSREKYIQTVGQVLGIRKMRDDHVTQGIQNPDAKSHKTMEWAGKLFKDADVKILDPDFKKNISSVAGQDDWKTFWPRMIAGDTELKTVLNQ